MSPLPTSPWAGRAREPHERWCTVILKLSNMCNGRCAFCAVGPVGDKKMDWESFELAVSELRRLAEVRGIEGYSVTFHGGEPTLMKAAWIDRACEHLRAELPEVDILMQSNLLAWSEEMIQVALRHRIHVGSSVDPIDSGRRDGAGADAFPRWLRNYCRLTARGLDVGSIFIVTREALGQAERLYRRCEALNTLRERRFCLQVNPVYPQGLASEQGSAITPEEYGRFLIELTEIWEASGRSIELNPAADFVKWVAEPGRPDTRACASSGDCSTSHVGIDYDLNVAACGRRLDSAAFFGNLRESHLDEILARSREKARISVRAEGLRGAQCDGCQLYTLCGGGCPDDADLACGDIMAATPWCESNKMFVEALEARAVKASLDRPKERRPDEPHARILVATRCDDLIGATREPGETVHEWLLPTSDGAAFGFDSALGRMISDSTQSVRIWVANSHARSLYMWRDIVADRRVEVVLFEGGDTLGPALNVLNALGARVLLDLPAILATEGGEEALDQARDRFLHDPAWRVQLLPFSRMLYARVHDEPTSLCNRWGLRPSSYEVSWVGDSEPDERARALVEGLEADGGKNAADWLVQRRPCMDCEWAMICGGQVSRPEGGCVEGAKPTVEELWRVGADIRAVCRTADEAPP